MGEGSGKEACVNGWPENRMGECRKRCLDLRLKTLVLVTGDNCPASTGHGLPLGHSLDCGFPIHLPLMVDVKLTISWSKSWAFLYKRPRERRAAKNECCTHTHSPVPTGFCDRQGKVSPAPREAEGFQGDTATANSTWESQPGIQASHLPFQCISIPRQLSEGSVGTSTPQPQGFRILGYGSKACWSDVETEPELSLYTHTPGDKLSSRCGSTHSLVILRKREQRSPPPMYSSGQAKVTCTENRTFHHSEKSINNYNVWSKQKQAPGL